MKKYKAAYLVSHPIQYLSPLFSRVAKNPHIDLTVLYCSDESIKGFRDVEFGRKIEWDIPLLEGYKYRFLKNHSPIPTIFKPPFGLINLGIIKDILRNKYDAVMIHGWHYVTHWLVIIAAILTGRPLFVRADSPLNQELLKPKWKFLIKKILFKLLFKRFYFLSVGTENTEFYKACGIQDKKIFSVPYAVDNNRFADLYSKLISQKLKFREGLGIHPDKDVILFCGKLIKKKRPMDLLKAYEKVGSKNKALIFAGEGALREQLEDYTRDMRIQDVYFLGFRNIAAELPENYITADIFVLPSTVGETWGLVVNAAMCFHLPVIVSDLVGCGKDLVRHGGNGFIFETGNIEKLTEYLEKLIQDPAIRKDMGSKSFEIIKTWNYTADIDGILRALETCLGP